MARPFGAGPNKICSYLYCFLGVWYIASTQVTQNMEERNSHHALPQKDALQNNVC